MGKSCQEVWENCLKFIKDNINYQAYNTWFEPIVPIKIDESVLTLQVPSQYFYEWLEENYIALLRTTIRKELGPEGKLEYSIVMDSQFDQNGPYTVTAPSTHKKATKNPSINMPIDINKDKSIANPFVIPGLKKVNIHSQLIESYSFDNFVEGECNRLARSAGLAVAENPGKTSFNPLFIYSAVGLGKTHLAHAIGIQVKNNFPDKTVLYVSTEQFIQQFVDSAKNQNMTDFIHFYQMIDVLIVDDIQFISGKEKTQDVFFTIFNYLHQNGKQIVITSDKALVDIVGIEPRLLSRFRWGLFADIQAPDLETRIAILEKKLYNYSIQLPKDIIEYIACNITTNIRDLEGSLTTLLAQSLINKKDFTLDLAKQMIEKLVKNTSREITIDYIQKIVCDYFNVDPSHFTSKSRKREIVQARQLAMFFSKKMTKLSLASIGLRCGNKDHATVLHACKTISNLIETDKHFKNCVDEIEKRIKM